MCILLAWSITSNMTSFQGRHLIEHIFRYGIRVTLARNLVVNRNSVVLIYQKVVSAQFQCTSLEGEVERAGQADDEIFISIAKQKGRFPMHSTAFLNCLLNVFFCKRQTLICLSILRLILRCNECVRCLTRNGSACGKHGACRRLWLLSSSARWSKLLEMIRDGHFWLKKETGI